MNTQVVSRTDPEVVRMVVKNVDGSGSMTVGIGVALVAAGASTDGVGATKYAAANAKSFVGVAYQNIPINGYGLVTSWGWAASCLISHEGTSITVTIGDTLKPGAVAGTFASSLLDQAISTLAYKYVICGQTTTLSAAAYVSGIVRAI